MVEAVGQVIFGHVPVGTGVGAATAWASGTATRSDWDGDALAVGEADGDAVDRGRRRGSRGRPTRDRRLGVGARLGVECRDRHGDGRGDEHGEQRADERTRAAVRLRRRATAGWLVACDDRTCPSGARPWPWGTRTRAAVVPGEVRCGTVRSMTRIYLGHGASGTAASMRPWVDGLRDRGFDAHAVELPKRKAEDAVAAYEAQVPDEPGVVIGGHSFGGRVASLAVAGVRAPGATPRANPYAGLVCLSYPLHRPGAPETAGARIAHWPAIAVPGAAPVGHLGPVRADRPPRGRDADARRGAARHVSEAGPHAQGRPGRRPRPDRRVPRRTSPRAETRYGSGVRTPSSGTSPCGRPGSMPRGCPPQAGSASSATVPFRGGRVGGARHDERERGGREGVARVRDRQARPYQRAGGGVPRLAAHRQLTRPGSRGLVLGLRGDRRAARGDDQPRPHREDRVGAVGDRDLPGRRRAGRRRAGPRPRSRGRRAASRCMRLPCCGINAAQPNRRRFFVGLGLGGLGPRRRQHPVDLLAVGRALASRLEPDEIARVDPGDLAQRPPDVPPEREQGAPGVPGRRPRGALARRTATPARAVRTRPGARRRGSCLVSREAGGRRGAGRARVASAAAGPRLPRVVGPPGGVIPWARSQAARLAGIAEEAPGVVDLRHPLLRVAARGRRPGGGGARASGSVDATSSAGVDEAIPRTAYGSRSSVIGPAAGRGVARGAPCGGTRPDDKPQMHAG